MPDDVARLPWTEEQWATVQHIVQEAARKARVASSFLPLVGPLPPGQASVPALRMSEDEDLTKPEAHRQRGEADRRLQVNDGKTLPLATIACEVYLTTQQAEDPDLASARQMLGRAATVLGRLEDAVVFWGQPAEGKEPETGGAPVVSPTIYSVQGGDQSRGLLTAAKIEENVFRNGEDVDSQSLVTAVVNAIDRLEKGGHYGPFACVLGHKLYEAANTPTSSMVLPSDRIVPFFDGGPLRRSSVVPEDQGVVVALAGSPIDLVVASDVHVRFLQLSLEPRYVLRVSERLVLRIKQEGAICCLKSMERPAEKKNELNLNKEEQHDHSEDPES